MAHEFQELPVVVIGGPTACGKSALALAVARAFSGTIINADSMQVYRELRVLTARPRAADMTDVPHRLYGVLSAGEVGSAAWWLDAARREVAAAHASGRLPLVVGGTGLYLRAFLHGLAPVAPVPAATRAAARALMDDLGAVAFHQALAKRDPVMAARLCPSDRQRLIRAWEVWEATGRSLAAWQEDLPTGAAVRVVARTLVLVLLPARTDLYTACDARFLAMVADGAVDEVRHLVSMGLPADLPVRKALGVPELARHLAGEMPLDQAITLAQAATRHYAKRQCTWFRHQVPGARVIAAQHSESFYREIFSIIRQFLLTEDF
ncbi:MAG: tRNA (adenosine(37)-N6)-dimethylallyltransferase MiaA [Alphaproteobacteria bacterium]|nr:tRNA (adenosine(37)-N6)-dimethylallyltransferase MiaA [Alphaproteobacteria bacterium]